MTAALEDVGISPRAHAVLTTALTGEHTQIEIARLVGLDKTTMVVTVDELEAAGLAERRPSSTDRRARVIAVTDAGKRSVKAADKVLDRVRDDVLSALEPDERRDLPGVAGPSGLRPALRTGPVRAPRAPSALTRTYR